MADDTPGGRTTGVRLVKVCAPVICGLYYNIMSASVRMVPVLALLFTTLGSSLGDEVQTTTGDKYRGTIVTFTNGTLVLKSEILGAVNIPRGRIASVTFGDGPSVAEPAHKPVATNALLVIPDPQTRKALTQLQAHTNFISSLQSQFLANAGAEANDKFTQMVNDLLSGKLSVADIRSEAASAASQLRTARKDLGEDSNLAIDGYLAILERFLANPSPPANSK